MNLDDLSLTPSQRAELESVEERLVTAWLEAAALTSGLRSPAGWFLAGVRSGTFPGAVTDNESGRRVRLAELRLAAVGHELPSESELLAELFTSRGALLERHDTPELRARMLERWKAMQALGNKRITDGRTAESEHSSQTSTALTAVSAHTAALDADADIAW